MDKLLASLLADKELRAAVAALTEWLLDTAAYLNDIVPGSRLEDLISSGDVDSLRYAFSQTEKSIETLPAAFKYLSGPRILRILAKLMMHM